MLSGHSSPVILGGGHSHRNTLGAIKRPTSRGSSSGGCSTPNNGLLVGTDGELHDPGYNESWQALKAQLENTSTASPLARKSTLNSMRRRSILPDDAEASYEEEEELESPASIARRQATALQSRRSTLAPTSPEFSSFRSSGSPSRPTSAGSGSSRPSPTLSSKRGGSLRASFSKQTPISSATVNPLDDWGSSFTGLVDVQRESRSRRNSVEPVASDAVWISRPSSPASSTVSGRTGGGMDVEVAGPSAGVGTSRRRSSDGSNRPGSSRRVANFAQETLKKARSESDPAPAKRGAMPSANDDDEGGYQPIPTAAGPTSHRLSPILSTSVEGEGARRRSAHHDNPLTPLDENGGYLTMTSALYGNNVNERLEPPAQREERERSHRLPLLGRRPSPVHQSLGGGDQEHVKDKPAVKTSTEAMDIDALRRKMQSIGLGMKFKTMRIKKRWADAAAHNGTGRKRSGSESS
ncbi:hypothetical protein BDZ90DRAFT_226592 [Jaminaea rosea]|uniref:Uncharacterized protein n=1 Tax=Jaminaea rosea TaxID=1569628 RepID=A0A316UX52_9BASI|nr:hypothetical protein BDZ90DRAFT_226592 [Jaminaea rosea]PWN28493.1 hypothetical protein BDZ90DRAFT_226592 [Jaminaea rosea]